jgi:hypothetical protein
MPTKPTVHRMLWSWKLAFVLLLAMAAGTGAAALAELTGIVERGALLDDASDVERWVVIAVALFALPFGGTCLRNAFLAIDDDSISALGFGLLGHQRRIAFRDVKRWGHGAEQNRGRRHSTALFETKNGRRRSIKLEMYEGRSEILGALTDGLGEPEPVRDAFTGLRFVR